MKGGAFMNLYEDLSKKNLDFSNKIRYFSSKQASKQASTEVRPKFRKIRQSPFRFIRRSFSDFAA